MKKIFVLFLILYASPVLADEAFVAPPCQVFGTISGTCLQGAGALGSPLSIGTLPAFTLGGTIAGGGNQINNISQVNIGPNVASTANLTINRNIVAPATYSGAAALQITGADGVSTLNLIDDYGTGQFGTLAFRSARGLGSAFTASKSGDGFGLISFIGASANNTFINPTGGAGGALIAGAATEDWSASAQGTQLRFFVTPNTTNTISLAMILQNSGGLTIGGSTDPGAGGLQVNAQMFMPNITTSSAAQTGTVCWTTGTGKFTVDTTVGCLTSLIAAKNITGKLSPTQALNLVSKLEPFAFRYKPGWGDGGHYEQFGFGAEQVAQVDERMVGRDPEGNLQGVRYQELTAVLAGAIQELKADNDNLRVCQTSWKCRIFGIK